MQRTIGLAPENSLDTQLLFEDSIGKLSVATYPSVSSESWFQTREIGKGTASVTENSRTLNAGERIAHLKRQGI